MSVPMELYGTCDCHVGVHEFQNDPDPCYGWWGLDDPEHPAHTAGGQS